VTSIHSLRSVHLELYLRWMQELRHFQPSTVSRRLSVVCGFYRTCVLDASSPSGNPPPLLGAWGAAPGRIDHLRIIGPLQHPQLPMSGHRGMDHVSHKQHRLLRLERWSISLWPVDHGRQSLGRVDQEEEVASAAPSTACAGIWKWSGFPGWLTDRRGASSAQ